MGKKILLIGGGIVLLLVALFFLVLIPGVRANPTVDAEETVVNRLVNTLAYATVSELDSEADYERVWKDTAINLQEQESYKIYMEVSEADNEGTVVMKFDGEDMGMYFDFVEEGREINLTMVEHGDYSYFGFGDAGVKLDRDSDAVSEFQEDFDVDEFKDLFTEEDWDEEEIEYKGLDVIGSKKYHVYYLSTEESKIWIDGLALLPVQIEDSDEEMKGTITYKDVEIDVPEDYEDITGLSEEEQSEKMFEILFGGLLGDMEWEEEDWDMDWDDEDWDMDWDDEDWDIEWDDEDWDEFDLE